jgi:hypothetical protein
LKNSKNPIQFSVALALFFFFCANATSMGQKIALTFSVALAQFPPSALTLRAQGAKNRPHAVLQQFLGVFLPLKTL